ncbi:thioesterase family protein [Allokutzneria sp. NRRL B-24872]|uniref:acyl-CoA thioesterase n=1 Tax=Allokutzneria sp. NRRL B-24872 TaxID=1137961 RepID=UPI000A362CCB|nr:hotdog domain-containing protein [Allokutzneria sp. NRRL B-24872]
MTFSWLSPVYFDELDLNGTLHNSRFPVHVERAQSALFEQRGKGWTDFAERDADLHCAVRELRIEYLAALRAPGVMLVELTGRKPGTTSAVYDFRCADPTGETVYAQGHRAIIKLRDGQPAQWSPWYREVFDSIGSPS